VKLIGALGADNEAALERLKRALIAQPGFQLILLEVLEGPTRDQVLEIVMGWSGVDGVTKLRRMRARGRAEIVPRLASRQGGILLEDIDSALLDDKAVDRLVGAMNWQRDQLRKKIAGPLILVISARGVARLFERAPDLVTWRSHTCRITNLGDEPSLDRRLNLVADVAEPDPIELERTEALLATLKQQAAPADELARAWTRMGTAHHRCGNLAQAREALTEAAEISSHGSQTQILALLRLTLLDLEEGQRERALQRTKAIEPFFSQAQGPLLESLWSSLQSLCAADLGNKEAAIQFARAAVDAAAPENGMREAARLSLASMLGQMGEGEEALEILESLGREEEDVDLRVQAAELAAQYEGERGRPDRAISLLRQGAMLAATDPRLVHQQVSLTVKLSRVLLSIGQSAKVRKTLRGIRKLLPNASLVHRVDAIANDGLAAMRLDDPAAVSILERGVKLTRGHALEARAQLTLSIARLARGDVEGSKKAARIGIRLAESFGQKAVLLRFQPMRDKLFADPDAEGPASELIESGASEVERTQRGKRRRALRKLPATSVTAKDR
jgi:tetratricopeptide (TPR) repeat protein